ncbi:MAG: hypothetical protein ACLQVL_13815 [Terriglobia bacterium]
MKLVKWFAFATLFTAITCLAQDSSSIPGTRSGPASAGYSLTIATPPEQLHLSAPINIAITVKNISDNEVYWRAVSDNTAYRAFHFLLEKDGKEVGITRFHRIILRHELRPDDQPESMRESSIVSALEPGKSFTLTVDLNKLYEITVPGQYTLEVSRTEEDNKTTVRSNRVTIKLIQ